MEANPVEAITNNVMGTRILLEAAEAAGVEQFVMISTDKAVNPTSVMGASKRAAELLVHRAAHNSGRAYVAVRFGNVLGSRGSVALTFRQQIAAGGPVTITHPDMVRYFMTIPEAVQLVLQAAVLGQGGEVFMLDMGQPVKIVDLARDLVRLSGLEVGRDIDIVYTGSRPGEKLFEELFVAGEEYQPTLHEKIFVAANATSSVPPSLETGLKAVEAAAVNNDPQAVITALHTLIPEYRRNDEQTPARVGKELMAARLSKLPVSQQGKRPIPPMAAANAAANPSIMLL
jgi:FlaA1/EpsC-like NDP-sugar epimerase